MAPPSGSRIPLNAQVADLTQVFLWEDAGTKISIRQRVGRQQRFLSGRKLFPDSRRLRPLVVELQDLEPNSEVSVRYSVEGLEPVDAWYRVGPEADHEPPDDFETPVARSYGGENSSCGPWPPSAVVEFEPPNDESPIAYYQAVDTAGLPLAVFPPTDGEAVRGSVPLKDNSCFSILAVDSAGNVTAAPYQCIGCSSCDAIGADFDYSLAPALLFFLVACGRGRIRRLHSRA